MLTLLVLATLSAAQFTADDDRRPRVPLCTAQDGELNRVLAVERADEQVWWFPMQGEATPYDATKEVTARQRDWFRTRQPLLVHGLTYRYRGEDAVDDTAFRRYNRPTDPVDGVPAMVPMGLDEEVWVLLDPVGCRFAVWIRASGAGD